MRDESIAVFLSQLAARTPAPGGSATAALHAAQAAGLIAMVARYSDGPRHDHAVVGRIRAAADGLVDEALGLAEADAAASGADLMSASARLAGLAEEMLAVANRTAISDLAAAAAAIAAAAATARVTIEAALADTLDERLREELAGTAALADEITDRAARLIDAVRQEING
jgi:formiminotetrahydrofolate cyclodeaminase